MQAEAAPPPAEAVEALRAADRAKKAGAIGYRGHSTREVVGGGRQPRDFDALARYAAIAALAALPTSPPVLDVECDDCGRTDGAHEPDVEH